MSTLLTAKDVQEILLVDRSTVYRMAEDGRIPAVKVGRQWRFDSAEIHTLLGNKNTVAQHNNQSTSSSRHTTFCRSIASNWCKTDSPMHST